MSLSINNDIVISDRIIYTPSTFVKEHMLFLQEVGRLKALKAYREHRVHLDSLLFLCVFEGAGMIKYGTKTYSLKKNDIAAFDCSKPYTLETGSNPWKLSWVHFYGSSVKDIFDRFISRSGLIIIHSDDLPLLHSKIRDIYALASSRIHTRDIKINTCLNELLAYVMDKSLPEDTAVHDSYKNYDISGIKDYIDEHYTEDISLESVADVFEINKFYLAKIFKDEYGMPIGNYIRYMRISKAKSLLRFTKMKIEKIGEECGVEDPNYFSRIFKKTEGITPGEYRKNW